MRCATCKHFEHTAPHDETRWGTCHLKLPPWITRSVNKAGMTDYRPYVRLIETCAFYAPAFPEPF